MTTSEGGRRWRGRWRCSGGTRTQQSADENEGLDKVLGPLKAQLKLMEKADPDLQAQQTYLTGLIAEEQSRWTTFNAMLDELAKPVEVKPRR